MGFDHLRYAFINVQSSCTIFNVPGLTFDSTAGCVSKGGRGKSTIQQIIFQNKTARVYSTKWYIQ